MGVDISEPSLRTGLSPSGQNGNETRYIEGLLDSETVESLETQGIRVDVGVLGDIREDLLPANSVDLVATTHTFGHLPEKDHDSVITHLVESLKPGGVLLLHLGSIDWFDDELESYLEASFDSVEVVSYRNPISAAYEEYISDSDGAVVFHNATGNDALKRALSLCLATGEAILPLPGSNIYVRCIGRN